MDKKRQLTPKREAFAQLVVTLGNASEAYRQVYSAENMNPDTVKKEASRLVHDPLVAARIDEVTAEARQRNDLTRDEVIQKFRRAYDMAMEDRAHGALSQAASGLARIGGFNNENVRVEDIRLQEPEPPEIMRKMRERDAKIFTPERLKAVIKADPAVMQLVEKWEKADQRARSERDRGHRDLDTIMGSIRAKGDLRNVLEKVETDETVDA